MNVIVLAKTKTEAEKAMNQLVKSGKAVSFKPAEILRNTDDEMSCVCPVNRLFMHTKYVDGLVENGKIYDLLPHRYRDAFFEAMKNNLKEFSFEIEIPD